MTSERETVDQTVQRSDSTLKRRKCAWCEQSLYRAKLGHCGAIYSGADTCFWVTAFKLAHPEEAK